MQITEKRQHSSVQVAKYGLLLGIPLLLRIPYFVVGIVLLAILPPPSSYMFIDLSILIVFILCLATTAVYSFWIGSLVHKRTGRSQLSPMTGLFASVFYFLLGFSLMVLIRSLSAYTPIHPLPYCRPDPAWSCFEQSLTDSFVSPDYIFIAIERLILIESVVCIWPLSWLGGMYQAWRQRKQAG